MVKKLLEYIVMLERFLDIADYVLMFSVLLFAGFWVIYRITEIKEVVALGLLTTGVFIGSIYLYVKELVT